LYHDAIDVALPNTVCQVIGTIIIVIMDSHEVPRKLWEHPEPTSTAMYKFMQECNKKYGLKMEARAIAKLADLMLT
jgi:hypothetical protein